MPLVETFHETSLQQNTNPGTVSLEDKPRFDVVSLAFKRAVEYLHKHKGYKPDMLSDGPLRGLMEATRETLAEPLRKLSVSQDIPPELTATLDENIFWFSGFKTHHELVEASRLLKDDSGGFRPFEQFLREVQVIDNTYNRNYLQAEYNFATASTQMAVKWKEWEKDGDRYDLQYRTAGDNRVREEHAALDGTTLPPSDPFWNHYLPPNGWNCRCTTVQVRKGKYPRSDSKEAIARGQACTAKPKQQIFRFNPGKQEKIFPPKHPYFKAPGEVKEAVKIISVKNFPPHGETYERDKESDWVFVSKLNKEAELQENVRLARFLSEKTDEFVFVLPHIQPTAKDAAKLRDEYFPKGVKENKNPDYFFRGRFVDGKCLTVENPKDVKHAKRSIQKRIKYGFEQADDVLLEIPESYSLDWITTAIKGQLQSSLRHHVVYVKHKDKLLIIESKN